MQPVVDVRKVDLWEGKKPEEIWEQFKRALDARVTSLFDPSRPRAFAQIRGGLDGPTNREN